MAGWRRVILIGAAVAGVAGGSVVLLRPRPVRVDVAVAERGPLRVTIDEDGETRVRERFVVAAPVAGRLARIDLKAGAVVQAGEVVARLDPLPLDPRTLAEARARLEAAEAAQREEAARVAQARASLAQASRSAERARKLAKPGTISPEERELAELAETTRQKEVEAALFAATVAAHNVDAARAALLAPDGDTASRCGTEPCIEVRAPVGGRVLRVAEASERVVPVGTRLLEIGDPMALEVVVDVLSADAVKVRPGAGVIFEDWGGDRTLPGRVRVVEPSGFTKVSALGVEEQRVNVVADFIEPPAMLADGYRLEARIVVWEGTDVLTIPASALFRRGGQWEVFAAVDGYARRRPVEVGHRAPQRVEVTGGLQAGEVVVLHPSDLVGDGTRVTATD